MRRTSGNLIYRYGPPPFSSPFCEMSSSLLAALLRAPKSYLAHSPNHGCEKLSGDTTMQPQRKEISKIVMRKHFYAARADTFFDQNRQIGSRCISALFIFKVGLQPRCIIFKAQAISPPPPQPPQPPEIA